MTLHAVEKPGGHNRVAFMDSGDCPKAVLGGLLNGFDGLGTVLEGLKADLVKLGRILFFSCSVKILVDLTPHVACKRPIGLL